MAIKPGGMKYAVNNCISAARIMFGQGQGMTGLDLSASGFWYSFTALLWSLPLSVFLDVLGHQHLVQGKTAGQAVSLPGYILIREFTSILAYVAALAVIFAIAASIRVSRNYPIAVIALNWAGLALSLLSFPVVLVITLMAGDDSAEASTALSLLILLVMAFFAFAMFNIIKTTFQLAGWAAILIVFVATVFELAVFYSLTGLFGL